MYLAQYLPLKAGSYSVHVRTGGNHIYCGLGEKNKCSPFDLTVEPGPTLPSSCEAQSASFGFDALVEVVAGETGTIAVQAKDAYGNNRQVGGDDVIAIFTNLSGKGIQYRGSVFDIGDGRYTISYSIPVAGEYQIFVSINGKEVQYCVGSSKHSLSDREYDGVHVYYSPSSCSEEMVEPLSVIHGDLYSLASTAIEKDGMSGLSTGVVGQESEFIIQARDQFGNLRVGSRTENLSGLGDGASDEFFITIKGPGGNIIHTSTNIYTIENINKEFDGSFRFRVGQYITPELPYDITAEAMQVIITELNDIFWNTRVTRTESDEKYVWNITFMNELRDFPVAINSPRGEDDESPVFLILSKISMNGEYPVRYTPWVIGLYEISIRSTNHQDFESPFTIEVIHLL